MAKGAYIGVGGVARKVKKGYVGVVTDVPIYETVVNRTEIGEGVVGVNDRKLAEVFVVETESYWTWKNQRWETTNQGKASSTATLRWRAKVDMPVIEFSYSYSSEANYDKFTITKLDSNGTVVETIANELSGSTNTLSYTGSLSKGEKLQFVYKKDSSTNSNDDMCAVKQLYVTTHDVTQVGTESKEVARRIKKAYIGVAGIARLCWSSGTPIAYYGTVTAMSSKRNFHTTATIGDYALIAGGSPTDSGSNAIATVETYNKELTKGTASSLKYKATKAGGASVGNYALLVGGYYYESTWTYTNQVNCYNMSLSKSNTTLPVYRTCDGITTPVYAFFYGGQHLGYYEGTGSSNYQCRSNLIHCFDAALTLVTPTDSRIYSPQGTLCGDKVILTGGVDGLNGSTFPRYVDFYDTSLTRTAGTNLPNEVKGISQGAAMNDYAVFIGTHIDETDSYRSGKMSIAFDKSGTYLRLADRTIGRSVCAAASLPERVVFAGGQVYQTVSTTGADTMTNTVESYDDSLTLTTLEPISSARCQAKPAIVDKYLLITGGYYEESGHETIVVSTVDAYLIT